MQPFGVRIWVFGGIHVGLSSLGSEHCLKSFFPFLQAFAKLKEYKESTSLSLQYVIDNHNLIAVDVQLMSSHVVIPQGGNFTDNCACTVINLGAISVKSKPISQQTRDLRELSLSDLTETFKKSLRDQVM